METPSSETLVGRKGKEVCNEPLETNELQRGSTSSKLPKITQNIDLAYQEQHTANPKQELAPKKDEREPSFSEYLNQNKEGKGESSKPSHFPLPVSAYPSRRPIVCKFCNKKFSTTQALGGHQNAHKQEREMQKALKVAHDFSTNPFLYTLSRAMPSLFSGSYIENQFQYNPYNAYAQRTFQANPVVYSHPGIVLPRGPPGLGLAQERFSGSTPVSVSFNPGWPTPYAPGIGPTRRLNGPTNFNLLASSNMTSNMQARENKANFNMRQQMQPTGIDLSVNRMESTRMSMPPKCNELPKCEPHMKQNESTMLDLNLKL